ncbi:MAG: Crp/Fnr family transcriptional regulator [Sphingomonadales bacterium]|nr:Crp/Fnr family transcriptional regulator [Sphingomonadales bacterium]
MKATPADLWGPAVQKLGRHGTLTADDILAITALPMTVRDVRSGTYLFREGDKPSHCCVLIAGYANRHKLTMDGSRQIVSIHLRGDIIDLQQLLLSTADHSVQTLTAATLGMISIRQMKELARERPSVGEAFWRDCLVDASTFREWVLNVGRRDAPARIAHLLCEFGTRSESAGLSRDGKFELPMTQEQLADATGLTPVHVNRTLQRLGAQGLIERTMRSIDVIDWDGLKLVAGFQGAYLHENMAGLRNS